MKSTFKTFGRYIFGYDDWWTNDSLWLYLENRRIKYYKNCLSAVFSHHLNDPIDWEFSMISESISLHTIIFNDEIFYLEINYEDGIFDIMNDDTVLKALRKYNNETSDEQKNKDLLKLENECQCDYNELENKFNKLIKYEDN